MLSDLPLAHTVRFCGEDDTVIFGAVAGSYEWFYPCDCI